MTDMMDALYGQSQKESLQLLSKVPPTLSVKDGVGLLSFEAITLSTFEAGKKIPAKFRWEGRTLRFVVNDSSMAYVRRTWTNVIILKTIEAREERPSQPIEITGLHWKFRLPPFAHQAKALELGAPQAEFAYLMDMGTGKTKVAIDDAAYHFARGEIDRVVVIAPNGVHEQWIDQALPVHWPLELPCRRDAIVTGRKKPEWWGKWSADPEDCKWLAVNIENINVVKVMNGRRHTWVLDGLAEEVEAFIKAGRCMVIIDEAHKIKNPSAKRSIACTKLGRSSAFRRILTGTPIATGIEDYFSQFRFLNIDIIGCWSMAGFKQQFCIMGGHQNEQIVGYRDTAEFHKRIASTSFRVEKKDVLDLPPKMFMERLVDMTPEQRRVFNELKNELMTELSDGTVMEAGQMVQRMLRLQQVTQGFLPLEDGGFDEYKDNRLPLLMDMLEQVNGRAVVWCRFKRDIERIMAELGDEAIRYDGSNKEERPRLKAEWMAKGSRKRFFVGNAQAGGTGLDWINGPQTVIYYSNSFSSLDRWQSEDRTHRIGTVGTVSYYDIICRGTLDRAIVNNLKRKKDVSDMSLEELKSIVADL